MTFSCEKKRMDLRPYLKAAFTAASTSSATFASAGEIVSWPRYSSGLPSASSGASSGVFSVGSVASVSGSVSEDSGSVSEDSEDSEGSCVASVASLGSIGLPKMSTSCT